MLRANEDVFHNEDGTKISIRIDDQTLRTIVEKDGMKSVQTMNLDGINIEIIKVE